MKKIYIAQVSWPSGLVHWTQVLVLSECGFESQAWPVAALVSLSKTLNHNCFVLWMGRKAVGPVCCVMHVKEPRTLIVKEKGLAPVFLDSRLEHPAGFICAHFCIIIIKWCNLIMILLCDSIILFLFTVLFCYPWCYRDFYEFMYIDQGRFKADDFIASKSEDEKEFYSVVNIRSRNIFRMGVGLGHFMGNCIAMPTNIMIIEGHLSISVRYETDAGLYFLPGINREGHKYWPTPNTLHEHGLPVYCYPIVTVITANENKNWTA